MVINKFDTTSKLHLVYPDKDKQGDIVDTVRQFIGYEQSRPPEKQLPHTPILRDLLAQWVANDQERTDGEAQRAAAAEQVQALEQAMFKIVRHARKTLDAAFPDNPAKATAWGFKSKHATKTILLPQSRDEHLLLLRRYIAKEQSRPAAERFRSPDLAEAIRIYDGLRKQLLLRRTGQVQREEAVATSYALAEKMHYYLQAVVTHLLAFEYDFTLTVELQKWGFTIVPRRTTSAEEEEAVTVDAPVEAEAVPTSDPLTHGSLPEDADTSPTMLPEEWE